MEELEAESARPVVAVVDDQELQRRVLRHMLEGRSGVVCVEGATGHDAVALRFGAVPPHLMLINGLMPGMDGRTAIGIIRAGERSAGLPRMPIVFTSSDVTLCVAGLQAGADRWLQLPIHAEDLRRAVDGLIGDPGEPERR